MLAAALASTTIASAAHAQGDNSAFESFRHFCLETGSDRVKTAEAARQAGWQDFGGGFEADGATVELVFVSPDQNRRLLMLMTVPASELNFDASGRICLIGETGESKAEMTRTLREWTGFAPENDGGFDFWAYSTIDGERCPERGLMSLPSDELIARVRNQSIQIIGVLPIEDSPTFSVVTPF